MAATLAAPVVPERRSAICWVDIFLLLSEIFLFLVMVNITDRVIVWSHRYDEPVKEKFEQDAGVPLLQAQLTLAQDELKAVQSKLTEQHMEVLRISAEMAAIDKYPPAAALKLKGEDPRREQRIKLATASAMAHTLDAEIPGKAQAVAAASAASFKARQAADLEYRRAREEDEFNRKWQVLSAIGVGSMVLFAISWFACRAVHKKVGTGRRPVVFIPALLFLIATAFYEWFK